MARAKLKLAQPSVQSHFPEKATMFETRNCAEEVIETLLKGRRETRIEPFKDGFVIKSWPIGKSHICPERRWVRMLTQRRRKKAKDGEEG